MGMSDSSTNLSSLSFCIRFLTEGKQPAELLSDSEAVGVCLPGLPEDPSVPLSEGAGHQGRQEGRIIRLHPPVSALEVIRAEHSSIGARCYCEGAQDKMAKFTF